MPEDCFCEALAPGWVRQPSNTLSSLAFVGAGVWVGLQKVEAGLWGLQRILVGAALLIGLGSGFYHASLGFWGQFWDVLGMYLLAVLLYRLLNGRWLWVCCLGTIQGLRPMGCAFGASSDNLDLWQNVPLPRMFLRRVAV